MDKSTFSLQYIEGKWRITNEADAEFLYLLQSGLLLALKERGTLTENQYRTAFEYLNQRCKRIIEADTSKKGFV